MLPSLSDRIAREEKELETGKKKGKKSKKERKKSKKRKKKKTSDVTSDSVSYGMLFHRKKSCFGRFFTKADSFGM